eukprot:815662-Pyramimonas_sp.AAC.1
MRRRWKGKAVSATSQLERSNWYLGRFEKLLTGSVALGRWPGRSERLGGARRTSAELQRFEHNSAALQRSKFSGASAVAGGLQGGFGRLRTGSG